MSTKPCMEKKGSHYTIQLPNHSMVRYNQGHPQEIPVPVTDSQFVSDSSATYRGSQVFGPPKPIVPTLIYVVIYTASALLKYCISIHRHIRVFQCFFLKGGDDVVFCVFKPKKILRLLVRSWFTETSLLGVLPVYCP